MTADASMDDDDDDDDDDGWTEVTRDRSASAQSALVCSASRISFPSAAAAVLPPVPPPPAPLIGKSDVRSARNRPGR
jgi:hypothetical protein